MRCQRARADAAHLGEVGSGQTPTLRLLVDRACLDTDLRSRVGESASCNLAGSYGTDCMFDGQSLSDGSAITVLTEFETRSAEVVPIFGRAAGLNHAQFRDRSWLNFDRIREALPNLPKLGRSCANFVAFGLAFCEGLASTIVGALQQSRLAETAKPASHYFESRLVRAWRRHPSMAMRVPQGGHASA